MTSDKVKIQKPHFTGILTHEYKEELFNYLLSNLKLKLDDNQLLLLRKAYNMAFKAHENQIRKVSKEPYIVHPVEVALIVANEMGLDFIAVLAAILHDVLEDSELFSYDSIKKEFGEPVALTVDGVTKMTKVGGKARADVKDNKINEKLETFKKLILSISKEYRVILIKIADRLHNMRTMEGMPEEKQKAKSAENLYVYAKFAEAVGMYDIKIEMEDLSFKYLYPEEYKKIINEIEENQPFRDIFLEDLKIDIYRILAQETNYNFTIKRIRNSYYSIWDKLSKNPHLSVDQIYNYESLRVVVDIEDRRLSDVVFNLFVKITDYYPMRPNSFRDWVRNPKNNGFRALVFDIVYRHHKTTGYIPQLAEIQIMSRQDDIVARKGANFERLKNSIVPKSDDESITEFINRVLSQLNTEYIYVFTPAGELHQLPKGATVIDFAFKIHTEIGLHCLGAKIQGVGSKPPTYKLRSGDVVEVLHSQNKTPDIEWLNKVVTDKARRELTAFFKKNKLLQNIEHNTRKIQPKFTSNLPIIIDGTFDFKIADCCSPLPGEPAVAVQDEKGNIIIHRNDCADLAFHASVSPSGVAQVEWLIKEISYDISIEAMDRLGLLKDILDIISSNLQLNISQIHMDIDKEEKLVKGLITVRMQQNGLNEKAEPACIAETPEEEKNCANKQLHTLIDNLKQIEGIIDVHVKIHHEK